MRTTHASTPRQLVALVTTAPSAALTERPGSFDWEVLADADAEYRAWLDAHHADAIAAIDAEATPANDNTRSSAA